MTILRLYEDRLKEDNPNTGHKAGELNQAHPIWVEFDSGSKRPATQEEVELWGLAQEYKSNFQAAAKLAWDIYAAAMGVELPQDFSSILGPGPLTVVKAERKRLQDEIKKAQDRKISPESTQRGATSDSSSQS